MIEVTELTGEGTNMPFITQIVESISSLSEHQRSLNTQQAVAIGCAIHANNLQESNTDSLFPCNIQEYNDRSISIIAKIKTFLKTST